jgi:hypothetical protein
MQRVDTATAAAVVPATDPAGTPGYFTKGNPGTGTPATVPGQDWFNSVQEELVGVILAAGLTLDKTNRAQLLAALRLIGGIPQGIQVYNTSGLHNFTVPTPRVLALAWGAGGGGSGNAINTLGNPGGGGAFGMKLLTGLTVGGTLACTVGAKGAKGASGGNAGTNGGTTSVGALMTVPGGTGGTAASTSGAGGGAAATGADFTIAGGASQSVTVSNGGSLLGGAANGGSAPWGGAGGALSNPGNPGNWPGGGGGAGISASGGAAGGDGADGGIILFW